VPGLKRTPVLPDSPRETSFTATPFRPVLRPAVPAPGRPPGGRIGRMSWQHLIGVIPHGMAPHGGCASREGLCCVPPRPPASDAPRAWILTLLNDWIEDPVSRVDGCCRPDVPLPIVTAHRLCRHVRTLYRTLFRLARPRFGWRQDRAYAGHPPATKGHDTTFRGPLVPGSRAPYVRRMSRLMSSAGEECVSAPTEMRSIPIAAISRMRDWVMPPDASSRGELA
jgi:hypothetical protein